ncbi:MAG TPA: histidine kinase [Gaiellaceae bacterium]|nr:histidine kinase [Gaiellaceae bacterium]
MPSEDRARLQDRLIAAEQDERRRIALFLHDGPVQSLSGIALMLDAVVASIENGKIEEATRVLRSAAERQRTTIRELRDLSFALEPVVLRDQGFNPAIQALAEQLGISHELKIELDVEAGDRLGEKAQIALYTIIRESLELAIRRGPRSRILVRIAELEDGAVETLVADDGAGERRRRAFEAIEERVRQLHGSVSLDAGPDGGTEVRIVLPPYTARR